MPLATLSAHLALDILHPRYSRVPLPCMVVSIDAAYPLGRTPLVMQVRIVWLSLVEDKDWSLDG